MLVYIITVVDAAECCCSLCLLAGDGGGQRGGQLGAEVIQLLLQGQHRLNKDIVTDSYR